MGKKNKEEADVKIASNRSLEEGSEKDRKSVVDEEEEKEEEDEEEENEGRGSTKKKPKHKGHRKGSEYDDSEDKYGREREDSVAVAIEDDAGDATDGKRTQKQANTYAAKKTVAQGMMDIALITANANQLRYIIEFNRDSSTFYVNVILIIVSLLLQVAVGISLIFKGRLDLRGQSKHRYAKRINNYVVVGVFMVTIINVFIASFTITGGGASDNKT